MSAALDQRLQLVISKEQVKAVDDWRRHQSDLPNRSQAIRRLIETGLKASDQSPIRNPKPRVAIAVKPCGKTVKPARSSGRRTPKAGPASTDA